jgi:hypothetical protein
VRRVAVYLVVLVVIVAGCGSKDRAVQRQAVQHPSDASYSSIHAGAARPQGFAALLRAQCNTANRRAMGLPLRRWAIFDERLVGKLRDLTPPPAERRLYAGFLEGGQAIAKDVRLRVFPDAIFNVETNQYVRSRLHAPPCGFVTRLALLTAQPGERHPNGSRGVATGVIWFEGGVCPVPGCGPKGGRVTVFKPSGRSVAHEQVRWPGPFSFALPAGRYQLYAGMRLPPHNSPNCQPANAVIQPDRTIAVDVETGCGIP